MIDFDILQRMVMNKYLVFRLYTAIVVLTDNFLSDLFFFSFHSVIALQRKNVTFR